MDEDWKHGGFGIYLHWPFCQSKCPYCDFNSHVVSSVDAAAWSEAFVSEIRRYADEVPDRTVNSIFFGGGTPSLMPPSLVETILDEIRAHWRFSNNVEITLEANPGSVEAARFRLFKDAGVNRISVGIQSLNDDDLKRLGRLHTAAEGRAALEIAMAVFDRVNFDLIYARQHQSLAAWEDELLSALAIGSDHLSLYQLTIEEGTAFGRRHAVSPMPGLPSDDLAADMYALTQQMTTAAGLPNYEISNYARQGHESRHNMLYWTGGDYLGIGPGAHGRITHRDTRFATETALLPNAWLSHVSHGSGESERVALTALDRAEEYLMMGLRISEGIDLARLSEIAGEKILRTKIESLRDSNHLWMTGDQIGATESGKIILNAVLREIVSSLPTAAP